MSNPTDKLVNDFAIRSFRDIADGDYIAARLACRAQLAVQYLWASQQAIEKYLKCILLLHRIPATKMYHDLHVGLMAMQESGKVTLDLAHPTVEFINYLDKYGQFRYLDISNVALGHDLPRLDRAVWELRRFCTLTLEPRQARLLEGKPAPRVLLPGGELEGIMANKNNPAREALLWQNGFFGERIRRTVSLANWIKASNSPLYLNPQILDEVLKFVSLPSKLINIYRGHKKQ